MYNQLGSLAKINWEPLVYATEVRYTLPVITHSGNLESALHINQIAPAASIYYSTIYSPY